MTQLPTLTRVPEFEGYDRLGSANTEGDTFLILIDGQPAGGSYFCPASYIRDGERWASWGPAGLSMRHATREDAEAVQVAALGIDPANIRRA